jgi:hypothetical protein
VSEWFHVSAQDNDSHMCGSDDVLLPTLSGVPVCTECGFKISPFFINPAFTVRRRVFDLSYTYDGYAVCSLRFRDAVRRAGLTGAGFETLPNDPDFNVLVPSAIVPFDAERRQTRFNGLCPTCGFHGSVSGATPVFLKAKPITDFCRSDVLFGSGNSRAPLLFASDRVRSIALREKLRGLEFSVLSIH